MDAAILPLREVEARQLKAFQKSAEEYETEKLRYDADLRAWRNKKGFRGDPPEKPIAPPEPRSIVSNTTIEALAPILFGNPKGLILVRDELSAWVGGFDQYRQGRGTDAAAWAELYGGRPVVVDRKTGDSRTIRIARGAVAVTGTIQPTVLKRLATPELLDSGLLPRVFFAFPPSALDEGRPQDIPAYVEDGYRRTIERLASLEMGRDGEGNPVPVDLLLSPEAERVWWNFKQTWTIDRRDLDEESVLNAVASKLEGGAARLSLLLHLCTWAEGDSPAPGPVSAEAVRGGVALAMWLWREARRLYAFLLDDLEMLPPWLFRLVRWLERRGGEASAREVQNSGPRNYRGKTETAEADLQVLAKAKLGGWIPSTKTENGGRPPSPRFRLSSRALEPKPQDFGAKPRFRFQTPLCGSANGASTAPEVLA